MTNPIKVTRSQLKRLEQNLAGQGRTTKTTKDPTLEIMTALQVAAGRALDLAGVTGKERRVLISKEFNQHCLKVSRELAEKVRKG